MTSTEPKTMAQKSGTEATAAKAVPQHQDPENPDPEEEDSLLHHLPKIKESKKVRLGVHDDAPLGPAGFILGEPEKPQWTLVPPDGGWGWLVLLGAMVVNILVPGTVKSFGVLFVEFLEVFDAGPAAAAWIPALCYFLYSSLGPVSSILSVKYSYQTVTILGGGFAAAGMILSCWASSVTYLYISYGVLVGTGAGLAFPPTVYIVTSYFVRLRGLANGLCMSGSALGSIILPPVLRFLLETYGYRGAILIMGGVTFHVWVAAIFFQPVEEHMKRVPAIYDDDADSQQNDMFCEEDLTLDTYEDFSDPSVKSPVENGFNGPHLAINSGQSTPTNECRSPVYDPSVRERVPSLSKKELNIMPSLIEQVDIKIEDTEKEKLPNGSPLSTNNADSKDMNDEKRSNKGSPFMRSASAAVVQNVRRNSDAERRRKISMPLSSPKNAAGFPRNHSTLTNSNSRSYIRSNSFLKTVPEGRYQLGSSEGLSPSIRRISTARTPMRSPSTSSFQYMSTPFHGSTLSAFQQPDEFASQLTLQSIKESFAPICSCCRSATADETDKAKPKYKFLDIALLKEPIFIVILLSNCASAITYTNFIILLPSYAINMGFDKGLAAYLLSIVSALDLVGRIGGSALSDINLIPKSYYFVGGLFFSGLSLSILPLFSLYTSVSICCAIFGLASGAYVGVTTILMAEMLGMERLPATYGISLFINGILQLIGPPICGVWFEKVGSYTPLFTALGIASMIGAAIWVFMPYLKRRQEGKEKLEKPIET